MENNYVLNLVENGIATITLNRPEAMNALNLDMIHQLIAQLLVAESDSNVKVIVLTGNGKGFCSGGDLSVINKVESAVSGQKMTAEVGKIASTIMRLNKPVVAMVNGTAAGAGFNMMLACDIIFSSKSAKFIQSFSKVGLISDCGGTYLLPKAVGYHKAKELLFTAETITADEALDLRLINHVVEDAELVEATYAYARKLAFSAPLSLQYMKMAINNSDQKTLDEALENEANLQGICMKSRDCQEGISAFVEKRKPDFKGL